MLKLHCRIKAKKLVSESLCHNGMFTAWIAFTQQVASLIVADLELRCVKAIAKAKNLNLHVGLAARGLYSRYALQLK